MNDDYFTCSLRPSYIEKEGELRVFQRRMQDFARSDKKICVLAAPTSAGKTVGFERLSVGNKPVIIVLPNNLLVKEVHQNLSEKFGESKVARITGEIVNEELNSLSHMGFKANKRRVIEKLISSKQFIITNPTVLYMLILNRYHQDIDKGDTLSTLIGSGLSTIVFDEFHIFDLDQLNIMVAMCAIFYGVKLKIVFSSATPPIGFTDALSEIFNKDEIETINVSRIYSKDKNCALLQGPIDLEIHTGTTISEFVELNHNMLKEGNWFVILDTIREIDKVGRNILNKYDRSQVEVISGYHDPDYSNYDKIREDVSPARIVIGSNIIEQGINPPKKFNNFIIDPGYSLNSIMQRIGRVGRSMSTKSRLIIVTRGRIENLPGQINNIDELYEFLQKLYNKENTGLRNGAVGFYLYGILLSLTSDARNAIWGNLNNDFQGSKILTGLKISYKIDKVIKEIESTPQKKKIGRQLKRMKEWIKLYRETMTRFIPDQHEIDALDNSNPFVHELLGRPHSVKYAEIWLKRNADMYIDTRGFVHLTNFKDKQDSDFEVMVDGLPFSNGVRRKFKDIYFDAYEEIMRNLKLELEDLDTSDNRFEELKQAIISFVKVTGGIERLSMRVIDD